MEAQIQCTKCRSTQLSANKKGFSGKKAVAGAVLTGGIGLLAGTLGSNKIIITCLNCGNQFKPGDKPKPVLRSEPKIIWDERSKSHVTNPKNTGSESGSGFLILAILIVVIVFVFMGSYLYSDKSINVVKKIDSPASDSALADTTGALYPNK